MQNLSIKKLGKKLYEKSKFKSSQSLFILGDPSRTPFLYLTFFAVLTSRVCRICSVLRVIHMVCAWTASPAPHLLPLFSGCTSVFVWHQQATKCNGFMNTIIRHDQRPLGSYRVYIQCTNQFNLPCPYLFYVGSLFKHCFVSVVLSCLASCCQINFLFLYMSYLFFLSFQYLICVLFSCHLDQHIRTVLVYFLGTCLDRRQMLLSDPELILHKTVEVGFVLPVYLTLYLWYKLQL